MGPASRPTIAVTKGNHSNNALFPTQEDNPPAASELKKVILCDVDGIESKVSATAVRSKVKL